MRQSECLIENVIDRFREHKAAYAPYLLGDILQASFISCRKNDRCEPGAMCR